MLGRLLIALVVAAACGKPATSPKPPADLDLPIDGGVHDAALVDSNPPTASSHPAVPGPSQTVKIATAVTLGDLSIRFASNGHKHGSESLGIWDFEITRAGKTESIELRSGEFGFEAEVEVHDALLVFRHVDYDDFVVTLAADPAPMPESAEGCVALVDAAAKAAKKPTGSARNYTAVSGVLVMIASSWRGYCGLYTRRTWFAGGATP